MSRLLQTPFLRRNAHIAYMHTYLVLHAAGMLQSSGGECKHSGSSERELLLFTTHTFVRVTPGTFVLRERLMVQRKRTTGETKHATKNKGSDLRQQKVFTQLAIHSSKELYALN